MLAAGYGRIINTASMASLLVPHPQKQVRPLGCLISGLHVMITGAYVTAGLHERGRTA